MEREEILEKAKNINGKKLTLKYCFFKFFLKN